MRFEPKSPLRGELRLPGDKSVCHRAVMLGALGNGDMRISHFSGGGDNRSTIACLRELGVLIDEMHDTPDASTVIVHGAGLRGLREPTNVLDAGNSGTTMRLLSGLLASQSFFSVLNGDAFLRKRPMRRVIEPLTRMGAQIFGREKNTKAPLAICGSKLRGVELTLEVASAQVKSALILAGLYADGDTTVVEPGPTRDHTERMLRAMGADIQVDGRRILVRPPERLEGLAIDVPGDISSAAFFIVAALIVPGSEILLRDVGVNPTRTGILDILRDMGGNITLENEREVAGEPVADLLVKHSVLKGVRVEGDVVVRAIDEFPVLAVAAALAEGETVITGAEELRVKETDRLQAMSVGLKALGAQVEEHPDGMTIQGRGKLTGGKVDSFHDHRIAMSFAVAGLAADGAVEVDNFEMVSISYPRFVEDLGRLLP